MMIYTRFADKSLTQAIEQRDAFTRQSRRQDGGSSLAARLLAAFKPQRLAAQHH